MSQALHPRGSFLLLYSDWVNCNFLLSCFRPLLSSLFFISSPFLTTLAQSASLWNSSFNWYYWLSFFLFIVYPHVLLSCTFFCRCQLVCCSKKKNSSSLASWVPSCVCVYMANCSFILMPSGQTRLLLLMPFFVRIDSLQSGLIEAFCWRLTI